jgi:hypothetical protein
MLLRILPQLGRRHSSNGGKQPARLMLWIWNILYIVYSLEVGIVLLCLPWLKIWENNYLLYLYPQIRPVVTNPFFKGGVLGLGIVNIMIGIHELIYLRRTSKHFSQ